MTGKTNDPAAGFKNMQAGSEEDFILNVGRRTFFTAGSATLDSVAKTTLDGQIAWLNKYPQWLVKLQGFADDSGGDSAQVALSQKRADAVMAYLAAGGVAPEPHVGQGLWQGARGARMSRRRPARSRTAASSPICATSATRRNGGIVPPSPCLVASRPAA